MKAISYLVSQAYDLDRHSSGKLSFAKAFEELINFHLCNTIIYVFLTLWHPVRLLRMGKGVGASLTFSAVPFVDITSLQKKATVS